MRGGAAAWLIAAALAVAAAPGRAAVAPARGGASAPGAAAEARSGEGQPGPSAPSPAPEEQRLRARPAYVLRDGRPLFFDAEGGSGATEEDRPHPGEVVGILLEGSPGPFELVGAGADLGKVAPLGLRSLDGREYLEVLLLGLGEIEVPSVALRRPEGTVVLTESFAMTVSPALAEDDETPAPPRGQTGIPLDLAGVLVAAAAVLVPVGAVAAFLVARARRRRRALAPYQPPAPEVAPEAWAHAAIDALLASNLLAEGRMKEFHIRLAEISKEYLSRRFRIHLMERTTAECPAALRAAGVDRTMAREVGEWLSQIDLVKFAGERPASQQVVASVQALRNMIERTTPRAAPPEIVAAAGSAETDRAATGTAP